MLICFHVRLKNCLIYDFTKIWFHTFLPFFYSDESDVIATGGKGDREIFVYKSSKLGKLTKTHCLRGHTGKNRIHISLNILHF